MYDKGCANRSSISVCKGVNLGRRTGPSPLTSVMVQEIDGDQDNPDNTIPRDD